MCFFWHKKKKATSTSEPPKNEKAETSTSREGPIGVEYIINTLVPPNLHANDASSPNLPLIVGGSSGTSTFEHGESSKKKKSRISKTVTFGQDDAFKEVCNFLKENEGGIVGIFGMGGVGKTTLLTTVSSKFLKPSYFKVIWIVVSSTVQKGNIQRSIMRELNLTFCEDENLISRGMKINEALYNCSSGSNGSGIALLLDDIWEAIDLEELGVAGGLLDDTSIFNIIFTTRSEDVCLQMLPDKKIRINPLGGDESWDFFNRVVGENILSSNHIIKRLARDVANECGGLPLALKVVGKAMVCKTSVQAWEHALSNLRHRPSLFSGTEKDLFERLKFSYDNLENEVERDCFLFCCMYPEDTEIETDQLIEFWIAEGIFDASDSDTYVETFNRGRSIVETLLAKSMLEDMSYNKYQKTYDGLGPKLRLVESQWGEERSKPELEVVKIHDVIRDMGIWISSKKDQSPVVDRWAFIKYSMPESYCRCWSVLQSKHVTLEKLFSFLRDPTFTPKLKVLACETNWTPTASDAILSIEALTELRHLEINESGLRELPTSIKSLTKLRVIKLNNNRFLKALPETIGDLCDLRRLSIGGCRLTAIPRVLENLKNLEIVEIQGVDGVVCLDMFNKMTNLRKLRLTVESMHWEMLRLNKLEELFVGPRSLSEIEGVVSLGMFNGLTNLRKLVLNKIESMRWEMLRLNKLEELVINVGGNEGNDSLLMKDIIELPSLGHLDIGKWPIADGDDMVHTLKTMPKLHFLSIKHTPLSQFLIPSGERPFRCLDYLQLLGCPNLKNIVGLQHLQKLRKLEIWFLHEVEECLLPDLRGDCMPNLRVLCVYNMKKMKRICNDDVVFPLLSKFELADCPMLEKLPRGLMKVSTTLKGKIEGTRKWWEGLDWVDDDFQSSLFYLFKPCFHPSSYHSSANCKTSIRKHNFPF